jgi:hypothetical protein
MLAAGLALVALGAFSSPTYATSPPGDSHRVFVTERPGRVRVIADGTVRATPFLDLTAETESGYVERGLLSVAFPPDYATSGLFYVYLTAKQPLGEVQVREYRRSAADPDVADPASGRIVFHVAHTDAQNHNGGQLQFGPDGKLYAATGDGGGGDDQFHHSQDPGSFLGKLVRIDPAQALPAAEVVARGLRNPWRFSFDPQGRIVIADVGQGQSEEIDVGLAGNYGWPCFEGLQDRARDPAAYPECAGPLDDAKPVIEVPHTGTGFCAIVGGYVVRDPGLPTLLGRYVFGDNCASGLRSADLADGTHSALGLSVNGLSSFGEDACGRILVVSLGGQVSRLYDGTPTPCGPDPAPTATPAPELPGATPTPAPTPASTPTATAPDRTPCRVSARVKGAAQRARRGYVTVALRTNEPCRATLTARLGGKVGFRPATVRLRPHHRTLVRLKLTRRRLVHRRLSVRIRAVDGAGNVRVLTR